MVLLDSFDSNEWRKSFTNSINMAIKTLLVETSNIRSDSMPVKSACFLRKR